MSATIVGWGMAVPEQIWTNAHLESMVDTTDAWIVSRTGIRQRRIADDGDTTFSLGLDAATRALDQAGLSAADVDMVIVATLTPETPMPATANLIQDAIGARSAGAFDLNAACAGFTYGLEIGRALIDAGSVADRTGDRLRDDVTGRRLDRSLDLRPVRRRRGRRRHARQRHRRDPGQLARLGRKRSSAAAHPRRRQQASGEHGNGP